MNSIRRKLTLSLVTGLFVLFTICGMMLYMYTSRALVSQFDVNLLSKVRTFVASTELEDGGKVEMEFTELALLEFRPSPEAEYYQVWNESGRSLSRSPSLRDNDLPQIETPTGEPRIQDIPLPDGRPGRAVALRFAPRSEDKFRAGAGALKAAENRLTLVMARSREDLDRTLDVLVSGLLATGLLLPVCAAFLVRWTVGRGLRPLDQVAGEAASIDAGKLDHRFQTESMPDELVPICGHLNELLERLDAAFRRERRFTADAAHELRTPIAELRSLAEVGLQGLTDTDLDRDLRGYFQDALNIALQMEHLVTTLLALARSESGLETARCQSIDFAALVQKAWRPFDEQARAREIAVDFTLPAEAHIETDDTLLEAILTNLFSNAVLYTPRAGRIQLEHEEEDGALRMTLSNTNNQLARADLEHLFKPFWRKDQARSDHYHSGVGLTLVAAYARLLNATVRAELPSPDLFRIILRHPVAVAPERPKQCVCSGMAQPST